MKNPESAKHGLLSSRRSMPSVPAPIHRAAAYRFEYGELYLFHRHSACCPACGSLWGIFDKRVNGRIYLETSSPNLRDFRKWHLLPQGYRYCRRASRRELRDYIASLVYSECRTAEKTPH